MSTIRLLLTLPLAFVAACGAVSADAIDAAAGPDATQGTPDAMPPPDAAPMDFSMFVSPDHVNVLPGGEEVVTVTVQRGSQFTDAITISVANLPPGITAQALTIDASSTTGMLKLLAQAQAVHSVAQTAQVIGMGGGKLHEADLRAAVGCTSGSLDSTFGNGLGFVKSTFPFSSASGIYAFAPQAGGKIVVLGTNQNVPFLARFAANGALDTSFGNQGLVMTGVAGGGITIAGDMTVAPDGKIVVVGLVSDSNSQSHFWIARFQSDGNPDTTLAGTGYVVLSDVIGYAEGVNVRADGEMLVDGSDTASSGDQVVLLTADGLKDPSFGTGGRVSFAGPLINDSVVMPDGRLATSGVNFQGIGLATDAAVAMVLAGGSTDASWGQGGVASNVDPSSNDSAATLLPTDSGKLVTLGVEGTNLLVLGWSASGGLDGNFGAGGRALFAPAADQTYFAGSLGRQRDGRIVFSSSFGPTAGGAPTFVIGRLDASGHPDATFGNSSGLVQAPAALGSVSSAHGTLILDETTITAVAQTPTGAAIIRYCQ
jgi:uncharacterized delta-60 repeat protein